MIKNIFLLFLTFALSTSAFADETIAHPPPQKSPGKAAYYGTRDATVLSMMGWGVAIAIGIGAVVALIQNDTSTSH